MEFEQQVAESSGHKMEPLNSYRANKSLKKDPLFKIFTVVFFGKVQIFSRKIVSRANRNEQKCLKFLERNFSKSEAFKALLLLFTDEN